MTPWLLTLALLMPTAQSAVDLSALTAEEKQAFQTIAAEEFCGCRSALTLAGCLEMRPSCATAKHLGHTIIRGLQHGATKEDIYVTLSQTVLGPFCGKPKQIDTEGAPARGPASAQLEVIEFADFRCAHCKRAAPRIKNMLSEWKEKVHFVFMPFPLRDHPESIAAAEAALAAAAQGKFPRMQELLFAHAGRYTHAALARLARKAGLDVKRFRTALEQHTYREQVQALKKRGLEAGIAGTPTFFVNGRPFQPKPPVFDFKHRLRMEQDRGKGTCQ